MITKLYVDNYKTLVDFTVEFQPLTLIVGANGAGKSAITEVLNAIILFARGKSDLKTIFSKETLSNFSSGRLSQTVRVFFKINDNEYEYSFEILHNKYKDVIENVKEKLLINNQIHIIRDHNNVINLNKNLENQDSGIHTFSDKLIFYYIFGFGMSNEAGILLYFMAEKMGIYQINPFSIRGFAKEENHILSRSGENFSAWYRHNQSEYPLRLPSLYSEIANFMPGFSHFRLSGAEGRRAIMCEFSNGTSLDFDYLSEGQKSLILLYSILIFSEGSNAPGQTLIFDEPDNFIALREIQPWLRMVESWVAQGKRQAILISHHPGVINFEGDEKVVWLVRENGGPTTLRTPTDLRETSLADQLVWDEE
jgi:predicted ATPase